MGVPTFFAWGGSEAHSSPCIVPRETSLYHADVSLRTRRNYFGATDRSRRRSSGTSPPCDSSCVFFNLKLWAARRASSLLLAFLEGEQDMVTRCAPCFGPADARAPSSACCVSSRQRDNPKLRSSFVCDTTHRYHNDVRYYCRDDENPVLSLPRLIAEHKSSRLEQTQRLLLGGMYLINRDIIAAGAFLARCGPIVISFIASAPREDLLCLCCV